jgi:hypothetical protein
MPIQPIGQQPITGPDRAQEAPRPPSRVVGQFDQSPVGLSLALSWRLRGAVGASRALLWVIRNLVAVARAIAWRIAESVGSSLPMRWRLAYIEVVAPAGGGGHGRIGRRLLAPVFALRVIVTAIGSQLRSSWRIRRRVGASQRMTWRIEDPITSTFWYWQLLEELDEDLPAALESLEAAER